LGNGATNVIFPVTVIALSLALMIGDGCAAYLSLCQGKGDTEKAHKAVGNAITITVAASLIFTALLAIFSDQILWGLGATENNIGYAREYFRYIIIGMPFYIFGTMINCIVRADGSPLFAMISTAAGCVINLILDPIAIFGLHWGMTGAALATIFGQIVTAILGIVYLFRTKTFRLKKESYLPKGEILKGILPLGISSFLTQVSIAVIFAVMNNVLVFYGGQTKYGEDIPMTVVGIVIKVYQIVVAITVGIAAGSQPIVGFNYGAGKLKRVKELYRNIVLSVLCVGIVATVLVECIPTQIISLFGSGDELYLEFAALAFRIYLGAIALCCIQKASSIFLQALGKPVFSTFLSLLRDFILMIPLILLLPLRFGVMGALISAPIADGVSLVVTIIVMAYTFRKMKNVEVMDK
jgi:putative MATE family efflux protein